MLFWYIFPVSPLHARVLSSHDGGLLECFALRHRYFVQEKRWVKESPLIPGIERDGYDGTATHFACFDESGVCAYFRALLPNAVWMLDREFSPLVQRPIERARSLELSRLVVRADVSPRLDPHPVEWLLRALYAWAKPQGLTRCYFVVEAAWPILFRRRFGLPLIQIGEPYRFEDGTETVLAEANIEAIESALFAHSPVKLRWYQAALVEPGVS